MCYVTQIVSVTVAVVSIISVVYSADYCVKDTDCICYTAEFRGEDLLVANCAFLNLTYVPVFKNSVQWIDLSDNNITNFNGALPSQLRGLNISNNPLVILTARTFYRLGNLKDLIMRNTSLELSALPKGIFKDLINLEYLDIKHSKTTNRSFPFPESESLNGLSSLLIDGYPDVFGAQMTKFTSLRHIDISGLTGDCKIHVIDETFFQFVENVTYLDLSGCQVQSICVGSFSKFHSLRYLDISHNKELSFAVLENVTGELMHTDIESLMLNEIHCTHGLGTILLKTDMERLKSTKLKTISVDSNRLELIEQNMLLNLPKSIEYISVQDNKLSAGLYILQLSSLSRLKRIDISHQQRTIIPSLPDFFNCNDKSSCCDRNSGSFQGYFENDQHYLESIVQGLENNDGVWNIPGCVPVPKSLETIIYIESKLKVAIPRIKFCDNNAKNVILRNNILFSWNGPIENVPHVKTLDLSKNFCSYISTYFFDNFIHLESLDISENFLGYSLQNDTDGLIFKGLTNLQRIDISSNKISVLPKQVFRHLTSLHILNVSQNLLTSLDINFHLMKSLCSIDLSHNQLPTITAENRDFFTKHPTNLQVNLTDNPLQYNCENLEFWKWLEVSTFVRPLQKNLCKRGKFKDMLNSNEISIYDAILNMEKQCASYAALTIGLSCFTVFVIALVISGLVYRYRWKLRYFYYTTKARHFGYSSMKQSDQNEDYLYDCFISYADEDRQFAFHEMMDNLETNADLRLCFHHRDFIPGQDIAENIISAIRDSRKTICVLSPNFLESYWCMYELNMARMESIYSRKGENILLLIVYRSVQPSKLPLSLLYLIESQSYIEYPADEQGRIAFWIKLKEAIRI